MNLFTTIALLELTDGFTSNDNSVKKTFEFYWNNYPSEFKSFPIVDTKGKIDLTLQYLEYYYNQGYRIFIGFSRSSILVGVLEWFNNHPDAIGFSTTSTLPLLNIPKKVFRMTPNDDYILDSVLTELETSTKVYYIYSEDEIAAKYILDKLKTNEMISPKLVDYGVKSDYSNLTVESIENLFEDPNETQTILLYVFDQDKYIDLYNEGLTFPGQQYNIQGIQPPVITGEAAKQLNNKYNVSAFKGTNTSIIWRKGYDTLGQNNYSNISLNILNLNNTLLFKENIENINSHFGILQFDPVSRDILYPSFLVEVFKDNKYNNKFLSVDDPILGKYQARFVN